MRATDVDGESNVLVQLVTPGVVAWELFAPSGDDLYAFFALLSDRRRGTERIEERVCRAHARWLRDLVASQALVPEVAIDPEACATLERKVVTVAPGDPTPSTWLRFEEHTELDPPGWYPLMEYYGFGTELWVWYLVPLKEGEPPEQGDDREIPTGFKVDDLYWGVELPLLLPE
ncbi:Hypothetical protein CAP_4059 [Chondromyces apiculatus DSM 436]|uniref:Uncharacterized protein n=1 Tax=Chondromyces apiculatus DSM 436 TaxID=1192034 RepID=A0A017TH22_9BACT|nr:Hypothetical protein CAP_4059 [Chondromyces apiculatus DSM 436]